MDPACDVMLAYEQNGERLTPDHGHPLRLIIPGYIGGRCGLGSGLGLALLAVTLALALLTLALSLSLTLIRMIKWLTEISVTTEESSNHFHYMDNRVLPEFVDAERATAEDW